MPTAKYLKIRNEIIIDLWTSSVSLNLLSRMRSGNSNAFSQVSSLQFLNKESIPSFISVVSHLPTLFPNPYHFSVVKTSPRRLVYFGIISLARYIFP